MSLHYLVSDVSVNSLQHSFACELPRSERRHLRKQTPGLVYSCYREARTTRRRRSSDTFMSKESSAGSPPRRLAGWLQAPDERRSGWWHPQSTHMAHQWIFGHMGAERRSGTQICSVHLHPKLCHDFCVCFPAPGWCQTCLVVGFPL